MTKISRPRTAVDEVADAYFEAVVANSPMFMTGLGMDVRQDEFDDLSPAGLTNADALRREALSRLDEVSPVDEVDEVTIASMRERLGLDCEIHEAGLDLLNLNGITSGLHSIRGVFDEMPTETDEQWRTIAGRLLNVRGAVDGWFKSIDAAIERDIRPAVRQVELLAEQVESWSSVGGFFTELAERSPEAVRAEVGEAAEVARLVFVEAAQRLRGDVLPRSTSVDGVGIERYRLHSRHFLGATIDLAETYRWGLDEVSRVEQLMLETADRIKPGASVKQAVEVLDADERYRLEGTDALREWMQQRADQVVSDLADVHFDIPEPVRRIECCIAPTHDGGIYYTGPSADFSRPGRMWWAVPESTTTFTTWRELTTVFHEGVPGHHLQIGQTIVRAELLNQWRRHLSWTSGYGEGWALYAEWLMADLGYLDDPGDRMGLLDGQMLRAVRVVIDLGIHCGFEAPELVGGGSWTFDKALEYFNHYTNVDEASARFEVNRYHGWPGQAPAYKLGERLWLQLRERVREQQGDDFDLKAFHRRALDLGGLGLDVLEWAMLREPNA